MSRRKTLAELSDADVKNRRAITVLRDGEPLVSGALLGTYPLNSWVAVLLERDGQTEHHTFPGDTPCDVLPTIERKTS